MSKRYIIERMDLAVLQGRYRPMLSTDGHTAGHEECAAAHIEERCAEGYELVSFSWWDQTQRAGFVFVAGTELANARRDLKQAREELSGARAELTRTQRELGSAEAQVAEYEKRLLALTAIGESAAMAKQAATGGAPSTK